MKSEVTEPSGELRAGDAVRFSEAYLSVFGQAHPGRSKWLGRVVDVFGPPTARQALVRWDAMGIDGLCGYSTANLTVELR